MTSRIDVFISYKREQRALSEQVKRKLIQAGYTAVTDLNISNNEDFGDAIDTMIRTAKLTLVLWTKASAASDWVRKEARLARDLEKAGKRNKYLGVMVEDVDLDMPADLRGLQMVDVHDSGLDQSGMVRLLEAVRDILGTELQQNIQTAEASSVALAEEWQLYDLARSINVAESYKRYLERYPNGEFASDASRQLGMFTWYLHPFRRGNIPNTLAAMGIVGTIAATIWGASRDPIVLGIEPVVHNAVKAERDNAIALHETFANANRDTEEQVASLRRSHQQEVDRLTKENNRLEVALSGSESSRAKLEVEILALKSSVTTDRSVKLQEECIVISDLCVAKNETRLDLSDSNFSDVSQLSDFRDLTWLNLTNSEVRDIGSFPNLPNLQVLLLGGPSVDNVNSLAKLANLRQLHLWQTTVKDLSPLVNLARLHAITMPDGQNAGSVYADSIPYRNEVQRLIDTWKP